MEYFEGISKVNYEGPDSRNKFSFRFYDANEVIDGKPISEHLRFAVCFWHTMVQDGSDQFGHPVNIRPWNSTNAMEQAEQRVDAFFELLEKLGVKYFCFHDLDIAPFGEGLSEFFHNLDIITDRIKQKMKETGIKLLWNTANLFSHPRYSNGAATSNEADVFAIAAAQVKKSLDISKKLGGENYVFWGGREGYESLLNTDTKFELDNMAKLFKMAIHYSNVIQHFPQFLIEPKPKEPMKHQYDFDVMTTVAFIYKYGLLGKFKLNIEANHATLAGHTFEHELNMARINNVLGSIDANQGDLLLGWDTDEFPTNIYNATMAMYEIIENGGIYPGGINFDAKVRRSSNSEEDLILAHIAGMDTYARAFKNANKMKQLKILDEVKENRYKSFEETIGKKIVNEQVGLEELTEYALKNKDVVCKSNHLESLKHELNTQIF